jgi:hypothetical protein
MAIRKDEPPNRIAHVLPPWLLAVQSEKREKKIMYVSKLGFKKVLASNYKAICTS